MGLLSVYQFSEVVTFDQNGQKCNFKLVAADLEYWQF